MSGWQQPLGEWIAPEGVIAIVVAQKFPDEALLRSKLREGIAKKGNTVTWLMREPDHLDHAARWAWDEFRQHGIEPLLAPTLAYWTNHRGTWRDRELLTLCERVIVFHELGSGVTGNFLKSGYPVAKVFKIERGEKKPKPRKGRKVA